MPQVKDKVGITGKVKIDTYRAGFVDAVTPYLEMRRFVRSQPEIILYDEDFTPTELQTRWIDALDKVIHRIENEFFIRTALECTNTVVDNPGCGLDLIIQRLIATNTYSLNITHGEIGTGQTTPALSDTALTTPTNRAAVGFQQDFAQTDAILQFFYSDSQLANETYYEFGTYVDGTTTIGSGQLFNHALFSTPYQKSAGTDTTVQVDFSLANA